MGDGCGFCWATGAGCAPHLYRRVCWRVDDLAEHIKKRVRAQLVKPQTLATAQHGLGLTKVHGLTNVRHGLTKVHEEMSGTG